MIKFLDLKSQYDSIKGEIDDAIQGIINHSSFIGGEAVAQFEKSFSHYVNATYCIGVANGTDALEIAIEALNLPEKSDILVPANSFIASSEAVTRQGHRVIFVDADPDCYTININDIYKKITSKTKAIIAVHLYGHPCDMQPLMKIAQENGLFIIEDCAQAHGAEYNGQSVGSIGHIAAFSFYPGKNLGAYGDAGAITTNNEDLAKKCRMIANHGRIAKYDHEFEGRNSRLDGLQAAILNVKLKHINNWTTKRIELANLYIELLRNEKDIILPIRQEWAKQVYHLFVIRTEKRAELKSYLEELNIQTGIHYPISLPKLKAYAYTKQASEDMFCNRVDQTLLSLPIGEHLSEDNIISVSNAIKKFFKG